MRMYDIIEKKRNGYSLSEEEIRFFIQGYTDGSIPDYQASALCMAIYFRGMDDQEISILTDAMAHSGDTVDLSRFGNLSADKHSTGGVGDKTSLIVIPVVASLGAKLAKMSGRGLGHTGGTVDKLESIPGYQTAMDGETFMQQVEKVGLAIVGQSGNLTPADKKLYALRDVTATVDSIPLITSSIMSKKLAAGALGINPEIFEAADIDGANGWQVFWKITIPSIQTILLFTLVTSLIGGLNMFDIPNLFVRDSGPDNATMTTSVFIYTMAFKNQYMYNRASALSMIMFLIIVTISGALFFAMRDKEEVRLKKLKKQAIKAQKLAAKGVTNE